MDKRFQLGILDQLAGESGQVSSPTKRLQQIDGWLDWQPLYQIGRCIDRTGPKGGQPRPPVRWMIRGLFVQYLYQLSDPQLEDQLIDRLSFRGGPGCRWVKLCLIFPPSGGFAKPWPPGACC